MLRKNRHIIDHLLEHALTVPDKTAFIVLENGESIEQKITYQEFNAFLVAGGDGTARLVIQQLISQQIPIAILPRGTFNLFAKEIGYPNNLEDVIKIILNNKTKLIDVGQLNHLVFINHSSIGFYSRILKLRKKHKEFIGKNKLLKVLFTAFNLFKALPFYDLKLKIAENSMVLRSCLIFIGNNYHFTNLLDFGDRKSLTAGVLSVYILKCKNRWEIFVCMLSIIFHTFDKEKYITHFLTHNIELSTRSKFSNVVVDGELFKLECPLNYAIIKKQLQVFVP